MFQYVSICLHGNYVATGDGLDNGGLISIALTFWKSWVFWGLHIQYFSILNLVLKPMFQYVGICQHGNYVATGDGSDNGGLIIIGSTFWKRWVFWGLHIKYFSVSNLV